MTLNILSWNIWWDGYFDEVSRFLNECDADIIGLQEVVPEDKTRDVIGFLTGLGYQHALSPLLKISDGRMIGNAVFSKHPIGESRNYILSENNRRTAVRADIKIGDRLLHVVSTHLFHPHFRQPSPEQEMQAENLIKALPSERTIVIGDFNATPDSEAVRKMRAVLADTDPASAPTWSVYPEGCKTCDPQGVNTRFDYIFVSKDLTATNFKVHASKGSDHLPISTTIEIP